MQFEQKLTIAHAPSVIDLVSIRRALDRWPPESTRFREREHRVKHDDGVLATGADDT
jgi:hypothetical protein